jgi:hypothetical protein
LGHDEGMDEIGLLVEELCVEGNHGIEYGQSFSFGFEVKIIKIVAGLVFTIVPVDKVKDFIDGVEVSIDLILADPRLIFGVGEWNVASFRLNVLELVMVVDDLLDFMDWVKDCWENRVELV